ncbi:MAG: OsmC family protein [Gammaproteobacteria bacterium]
MSQATVKTAIDNLAAAITENPKSAQLKYRAEVIWDGDVHCTSQVRNLPPVPVDEPTAFGGGDMAQSPGDLILTALGTCQGIMYAALASAMGIELTSYKVKLEGNLDLHGLFGMGVDKGIPPGFQDLSFESIIESPASDEELKQLVDAVEAQCPILDTLVRAVPVTGTATINGKSGYIAAKAA